MSQIIQTMEQKRAKFALQTITKLQSASPDLQADVRRHANSLPALIHMNGLGQALAFFRTKGPDGGHHQLYEMLNQWLCKEKEGRLFEGESDLLTAITKASMQDYMSAQGEAQALLEWVKKFALAYLKKAD